MGWEETEDSDESASGGLDLDISEVAPDAMNRAEATEKPNLDTTLVWADPGDGKTHYAYTMPDPVVVIDTEGKAHEIAHKFDGITEQDPFIFHAEDYDEAVEYTRQALQILNKYKEEFDARGTLVVDSMSKMWEWSKIKYMDEYYPNTPNEEIELGFGTDIDNWKVIKEIHNEDFRDLMLNAGFNVCWTARRKDDINKKMEESLDYTPQKPEGEKSNVYEANTILHVHRNNAESVPEAQLEKSGRIKHHYSGLTFPTYDSHKEVVEAIEEVEVNGGDMSTVEEEYSVRVFEGKPKYHEDS